VSAGNAPIVDEWLADLADAVDEVRSTGDHCSEPESGAYSTLE
jgi:hypothetical protein